MGFHWILPNGVVASYCQHTSHFEYHQSFAKGLPPEDPAGCLSKALHTFLFPPYISPTIARIRPSLIAEPSLRILIPPGELKPSLDESSNQFPYNLQFTEIFVRFLQHTNPKQHASCKDKRMYKMEICRHNTVLLQVFAIFGFLDISSPFLLHHLTIFFASSQNRPLADMLHNNIDCGCLICPSPRWLGF